MESNKILQHFPASKLILFAMGIVIVSASLFMISESGEFYKEWYPEEEYKGYWCAFLIEIFLTMTAAGHFQGHKNLNKLMKILMVLLFLSVVSGSSFNLIVPMTTEYTRATNQNKLISVLEKELIQNEAALNTVKGQPVNTILGIKKQRKTNQEYKDALKNNQESSWIKLVVLIMTAVMRIAVQAANLAFAHGFGILYRKEKRRQSSRKISSKKPSVLGVKKIGKSA